MRFPRSSGILLPPTSLPSRYGIGDLGTGAFWFADFLADCGQTIWQILPLGPPGYGNSPYQCFSAFAGNPLLIDLEDLAEQGLLSRQSLQHYPSFPAGQVDYDRVAEAKMQRLRESWQLFRDQAGHSEREALESFCRDNRFWLDDYALFAAVKESQGGAAWNQWPEEIALRRPEALERWNEELGEVIGARRYIQYIFYSQWGRLRDYCRRLGIRVMGDIPIFVAYDSADVWANPHLFDLNDQLQMRVVAGVPPDYFSSTGQLWGNPLYLWRQMADQGYDWWIERFRWILSAVEIVRIDHFRGFAAYWEVPAGEPDARGGKWVPGPGIDFFKAIGEALGQDLPVVAENLGEITPDVEELRKELGFPGMAVLQFGFGQQPQEGEFLPHNFIPHLVAYSGTHDNDTLVGWWQSRGQDQTLSSEQMERERVFARHYLGLEGKDIHWAAIRALLASVADTIILPLQDVLGLGSEARMNLPGSTTRNWAWRFTPEMLTEEARRRLRDLTWCYGRSNRRPDWAAGSQPLTLPFT